MHLGRQLNCWSIRCSWSIACRRCSIYIVILFLTPGFNRMGKDKCKTRWESFKFWDLVHLILEILKYVWGICTLRLRQDGHHFADDIFKCIFLNENNFISIEISLKYIPKGPIINIYTSIGSDNADTAKLLVLGHLLIKNEQDRLNSCE